MRIATAVFAAATVALALTSCSSNGGTADDGSRVSAAVTSAQEAAGSAVSSAQEAAGSAVSRAGEAVDQVKLAAFVGAFRVGYADLAAGRDDASIEGIVTDTCPAIAAGEDEQAVINQVGALAANNGAAPTPTQAERIYQLVKVACP